MDRLEDIPEVSLVVSSQLGYWLFFKSIGLVPPTVRLGSVLGPRCTSLFFFSRTVRSARGRPSHTFFSFDIGDG